MKLTMNSAHGPLVACVSGDIYVYAVEWNGEYCVSGVVYALMHQICTTPVCVVCMCLCLCVCSVCVCSVWCLCVCVCVWCVCGVCVCGVQGRSEHFSWCMHEQNFV